MGNVQLKFVWEREGRINLEPGAAEGNISDNAVRGHRPVVIPDVGLEKGLGADQIALLHGASIIDGRRDAKKAPRFWGGARKVEVDLKSCHDWAAGGRGWCAPLCRCSLFKPRPAPQQKAAAGLHLPAGPLSHLRRSSNTPARVALKCPQMRSSGSIWISACDPSLSSRGF